MPRARESVRYRMHGRFPKGGARSRTRELPILLFCGYNDQGKTGILILSLSIVSCEFGLTWWPYIKKYYLAKDNFPTTLYKQKTINPMSWNYGIYISTIFSWLKAVFDNDKSVLPCNYLGNLHWRQWQLKVITSGSESSFYDFVEKEQSQLHDETSVPYFLTFLSKSSQYLNMAHSTLMYVLYKIKKYKICLLQGLLWNILMYMLLKRLKS